MYGDLQTQIDPMVHSRHGDRGARHTLWPCGGEASRRRARGSGVRRGAKGFAPPQGDIERFELHSGARTMSPGQARSSEPSNVSLQMTGDWGREQR